MAVVNVNREVEDQFYRYKMPKIIAKVEGKGNGIKTVIVNMPEVSKALDRPPTYPCKYFGCELGAQVQFDKNERYIVNGSHEAAKLQDLLDGFIRKFVLCQGCDNPETKLVVQGKKGMIVQRCAACGHQGDIDMRHKFTTYILKNPPNQDKAAATPSKGKKSKKKDSDSAESPEAGQGDTNGQVTPPDNGFGDDDEDWGEDASEEAVKKRLDEISGAARSMTINDDLEKTQAERIDIFYKFVEARKNKMSAVVEKEILGEAERLDVKEKAPLVLAELLYDANMVAQIKQYRTLFLRFTYENGKAQKYLLGAFEKLVGELHRDVLMPKVPHLLKQFYDTDVVDEEVILDWDKKVSKKYVNKETAAEIHKKAEPFIKWLSQAEEESSEEEEEDLQVDFSRTEKVGTQVVKVEKPAAPAGQEEEEDDDLDIDDI